MQSSTPSHEYQEQAKSVLSCRHAQLCKKRTKAAHRLLIFLVSIVCALSDLLSGQRLAGVQGNHQLFVGWDHPGAHPAPLAAEPVPSPCVGLFVEFKTQPLRGTADTFSDRDGVLADSPGEDQRIEPPEGCGKRAQLTGD